MRLHSLSLHALRPRQALALFALLTLLTLATLLALRGGIARQPTYGARTAASAASAASDVMAAPAPAVEAAPAAAVPNAVPDAMPDAVPDAMPNGVPDVAADAMLVRSGAASVEVDSVDAAAARVRALATQLGGFVASTSLAAGRAQVRSATLEVKVPAARFDALVSGLAPLGRVETVNVTAEDVGEEFVDVAAREANGRRLESRLVDLLAQRAGRLGDVLAVERELARVREEIERYEGRLRFLRAHAATSTLAVTVHERPPLVGDSPAASPIGDAVRQAWRNFVGLVAWLIAASGVLVPLGIIALLGWRIARRHG